MLCAGEFTDFAITTVDGGIDVGKAVVEALNGKVSWSSVLTILKTGTATAKMIRAWEKYSDCLDSQGKTAEAGALRDAMEKLQQEIDLINSRLEGWGYTGVTEDGAPYSGVAQ